MISRQLIISSLSAVRSCVSDSFRFISNSITSFIASIPWDSCCTDVNHVVSFYTNFFEHKFQPQRRLRCMPAAIL